MSQNNGQEIREYIKETTIKLGKIALEYNRAELDRFEIIEKDGKRYSISLTMTVREV